MIYRLKNLCHKVDIFYSGGIMFETIGGIKLQGGFFRTPKIFMPFHRPPNAKNADGLELEKRVSVIYGKNGSGKTSIARAIHQYSQGLTSFLNVDLLGNNENILNKDNDCLKQIHVFNEDFIHREIRFTDDEKLKAIVLFGEDKLLDEQINNLKAKIKPLKEETLPELNKASEIFNNSANIVSPIFYKNQVQQCLKDNWSKREQEIRQLNVSARVENTFIETILNTKIIDTDKEVLKARYKELIDKLKNTTNKKLITPEILNIVIDYDLDEQIHFLLETVIKKPIFTEREKIIFDLIEHQSNQSQLHHIKESFSDPQTEYCPFCFQPVSQEYRDQLLNSIRNVFNSEEALEHQQKIDKFKINKIIIDLEPYKPLDTILLLEIDKKIIEYNQEQESIINILNQKMLNVYSVQQNFKSSLNSKINEINTLLIKLESERKEFNKAISSRDNLIKELQKINFNLSLLECEEYTVNYHNQQAEQKSANQRVTTFISNIQKIEQEIDLLQAQKVRIDLAIDIINRYLSYVFFSTDRLKVEIDNGEYAVKVRGERIELKKLSEGEKNAIALCYFFSTILKNKDKTTFFKEKIFLVLDDPISSFDFTNKVGIYSLLRRIFENIFIGNKDSRILILTHQIESVFHFQKVCNDLEREKSGIKINSKSWIIDNQSLQTFSYDKYNEYTFLLNIIFNYACQNVGYEEYEETIGNIMRRILEGFGTFNYKKGIEDLSCNQDILSLIPDQDKREYFKNLMYRLVLNCESHLEYQARALPDTDFFSYISQDEKIRTAKKILIFLNLINPLHIKCHLESAKNNYLEFITTWESELLDP